MADGEGCEGVVEAVAVRRLKAEAALAEDVLCYAYGLQGCLLGNQAPRETRQLQACSGQAACKLQRGGPGLPGSD